MSPNTTTASIESAGAASLHPAARFAQCSFGPFSSPSRAAVPSARPVVTSCELLMSWWIRGSYFESCNCEAVGPCRRIDAVPGGRSTHGVCLGVLSWLIEEGVADDVDLS